MKNVIQISVILASLVAVNAGFAQNATLELPESTLNRIVNRIGVLSDGGVSQPYSVVDTPGLFEHCVHVGYMGCPELPGDILGLGLDRIPLMVCREVGGNVSIVATGEPVPWQWWITDALIEISDGRMKFTATVTTHIENDWEVITKTVDATVVYDDTANKLKLEIDDFLVHINPTNTSIVFRDVDPIDVAKFYGITIPIVPQQFSITLPNGAQRNVTARVEKITAVEFISGVEYIPDALKVTFDVDF